MQLINCRYSIPFIFLFKQHWCVVPCSHIAYSQRLWSIGQSVVVYIERQVTSGIQHIVIILNVLSIHPGIFVLLLWREKERQGEGVWISEWVKEGERKVSGWNEWGRWLGEREWVRKDRRKGSMSLILVNSIFKWPVLNRSTQHAIMSSNSLVCYPISSAHKIVHTIVYHMLGSSHMQQYSYILVLTKKDNMINTKNTSPWAQLVLLQHTHSF